MPTIEDRLHQWRQDLLDFSNRNRLLNFRWSTTRPSSIHLIAPEASSLFQEMLQGKALTVVGNDPPETQEDEDDSLADPQIDIAELVPSESPQHVPVRSGTAVSSLPTEKTNRVLLRLLSRARTSEQELGINTLFAVFGLLKWQENAGESSWHYAPLVMLPLVIEERTREGRFRVSSAGEDLEFNQTIAERLKRDLGLDIAVDLDEETDLTSVFSAVRQAVSGRPGWEVLEHVHIGHFQFYKLRMYADLTDHANIAASHDIVQSLGSDLATIAGLPENVPSEEEFDRLIRPEDAFTILDADASQLGAVQAVVRGAHLIIQGPPGTGKSQTIANIIAESIANGRTVLFVSEKAAAIDVVHRRLAENGLAGFCLMLHSHKANKREIIAELGARLDPEPLQPASTQEQLKLTRLQEQRQRLNAYADALHRAREPLGESIFWVHNELARLQETPLLMAPAPNVALLTHSELDRQEGVLNQLSHYDSILDEGPEHPWAGARLEVPTLVDRQQMRDLLAALVSLVATMRETGAALAGELGLRAPRTVEELTTLKNVAELFPRNGSLRPEWFQNRESAEAAVLVADARKHATAKRELQARLLDIYDPDILEIEPDDAIAAYEQGFLSQLFSSSYKALRNQVHALTKGAKKLPTEQHLAAFRDIQAYRQHLVWFEENDARLTDLLGLSQGKSSSLTDTGWQVLGERVALAGQIRQALRQSNVPVTFVDRACQANLAERISGKLQHLRSEFGTYSAQMTSLSKYFENGAFPEELQGNLEFLEGLLAARAARLHEFDSWIQAQRLLREVKDAGLVDFVHALIGRKAPYQLWGSAYRRQALTSWLDLVVPSEPVLGEFSGEVHDRQVIQFRELDREYIRTSSLRARRAHFARKRPVTTVFGGEPQILKFEAQKRRRHMPLRRLFERIPNLLPTLKPCLMMSPLAVAQYLPADLYHFDLVIFDEASQVRPHDAIGAIMRGSQLIVAGDSKQLPPTTFFDRVTDDGLIDEDQDIRALESILDALNAKGMPAVRLLWHYRSRHEDLIAYSTHHFYDDRLVTFPSPTADRSPSRGVRLEYVSDGVYEDERDRVLRTPIKVNRIEAKRVAQLVVQHARSRPHESLGVVTLGMNQRDIVEEEIKQVLGLQRDLDDFFQQEKSEPFFVKALEQVQGDERDVIIISVGYGKNSSGVLSHNFGPINQQGGERRLNVLVTRARNQVQLVSSIQFTDIDPNRTQNVGPRLLRNYLEFAERGSAALQLINPQPGGEYESPFEEQVGEALRRAGFTVHPQVGASKYRIDLAIVDPRHSDRYILGVECDGRTYHQSKTARDRDRLRQEILEQQGWAIHRIWSTEWMRHPEHELHRVVAHVQSLLDGNGSPTPSSNGKTGGHEPDINVPAPPAVDEGEIVSFTNDAIAVPYKTVKFPLPAADLWETPIEQITQAIIECVEVEGPIHQDLLLRRIVTLWGYQRAGSRLARHVHQATRSAVQRDRIRQHRNFLWPARSLEVIPRAFAEDGSVREIAHVPDEEIEQAIVAILRRALSLSLDELPFQAARLFGFQRTGRDIKVRIVAVVEAMSRSGTIQVTGDRVQLGRAKSSGHDSSGFISQMFIPPVDLASDWTAPIIGRDAI